MCSVVSCLQQAGCLQQCFQPVCQPVCADIACYKAALQPQFPHQRYRPCRGTEVCQVGAIGDDGYLFRLDARARKALL